MPALRCPFDIGAIGTGLIIGSSTALVRGRVPKAHRVDDYGIDLFKAGLLACSSAMWSLVRFWLINVIVTDASSGVDWYDILPLRPHLGLILSKAGAL